MRGYGSGRCHRQLHSLIELIWRNLEENRRIFANFSHSTASWPQARFFDPIGFCW
jgi:hypothetical protein